MLGHMDVSTQSLPAAGVLALSALLLIVARTWRRRSAWAPVDASEDPDEGPDEHGQAENARTMAIDASSEHFLPATRRPPWLGGEAEDEDDDRIVDQEPSDDEVVIL